MRVRPDTRTWILLAIAAVVAAVLALATRRDPPRRPAARHPVPADGAYEVEVEVVP